MDLDTPGVLRTTHVSRGQGPNSVISGGCPAAGASTGAGAGAGSETGEGGAGAGGVEGAAGGGEAGAGGGAAGLGVDAGFEPGDPPSPDREGSSEGPRVLTSREGAGGSGSAGGLESPFPLPPERIPVRSFFGGGGASEAGAGVPPTPVRPIRGSSGGGSGERSSDGSSASAATAAATVATVRAARGQLTLKPLTTVSSPGGRAAPRYSPPPLWPLSTMN